MSGVDGQLTAETNEWGSARIYLALAGFYLVVIGLLGFVEDRTFPTSPDEVNASGTAYALGVFETNGWHNLAGLVFGAIALYFLLRTDRYRLGALIVGVPNALVFVTFELADPATFLFASNGADNVVHALLGFGGIAAALLSKDR